MKLSELLPQLTVDERAELAASAGTSGAYLWQLATRWQGKKPSIGLLSRLATADKRLTVSDMVEEFSEAKAA